MFFHPKDLKSENNQSHDLNHYLIFYCTTMIVCATVDSQCLEYLGYITLSLSSNLTRLKDPKEAQLPILVYIIVNG